MAKSSKKLALQIVLLVMVLVSVIVGMVYFVNWRATQDYITCVVARDGVNIKQNTEILTTKVDDYFEKVSVKIPDTQKGRVPITLEKLKEDKYFAIRDIHAGDIIFDNYDVSKTSQIVVDNKNRIEIPLVVNLNNVAGGRLSWNQKVLIYGVGNILDSSTNTSEWRTKVVSKNALVKKLPTEGGASSYTFEVDKSDVATLYYLSSACQLYFLPYTNEIPTEESATEIIQSLTGVPTSSSGEIIISKPYDLSILESNLNKPELPNYQSVYNLKVITNETPTVTTGFNFEWSQFKPNYVRINHTPLSVNQVNFKDWTGIYTVNNSDLNHRINYNKVTGMFSFERQDLEQYTFGEEGYYEMLFNGTKVYSKTLEDGEVHSYQVPVNHYFRFLITTGTTSNITHKFVDDLSSKQESNKYHLHFDQDFKLLHEDKVRFTPDSFRNDERLKYVDFGSLSNELQYKKAFTEISSKVGEINLEGKEETKQDNIQKIIVGRTFEEDNFEGLISNHDGKISDQKVVDFAKTVVYIAGGNIAYENKKVKSTNLENTNFDEQMLINLKSIINGEFDEANPLYKALSTITTNQYNVLLSDLYGSSVTYIPSNENTTEGDKNIVERVNTLTINNTDLKKGRVGALDHDLANIYLIKLASKGGFTTNHVNKDTLIRLTNLINYQVVDKYIGIKISYQNYMSVKTNATQNKYKEIVLQDKEKANSSLLLAVDGLN